MPYLGTIPACTGKPLPYSVPACPIRDYPRMHGETTPDCVTPASARGLSPHARGNRVAGLAGHAGPGTIPACTGKPRSRPPRRCRRRDYPRMHGETMAPEVLVWIGKGLSPHARGNRELLGVLAFLHGTIPACTGKPPCRNSTRSESKDYPRMHGETQQVRGQVERGEGLSPHARGNRTRPDAPRPASGLSPHARGNPARSP